MAQPPPLRSPDEAVISRSGLSKRVRVDADATNYSAMARSPSAATARLIGLSVTTNQLDLRGGKSLHLYLCL